MRSPDISIVIPCRNERERLDACLAALEGQDVPRGSFEIIVIDGGSTDGSGALALTRDVTLLTDQGRGPAAARNLGIARARGEIVAFTDADCVPRFDWLSQIAAALRADPEAAGAAGSLRLPRAHFLGRFEDNDARVHYAGYITSNVAYRREALAAVGGFDESLHCAEDYDLAWRLLDAGYRIVRAPDAIVLHDPPEVAGALAPYLGKQFWYARHDVPAHARAILRARGLGPQARGSHEALAGLGDALQHSALALGLGAAVALRSRTLLGIGAAAAVTTGLRHASRTVAEVGEGARELPRMALVESAKRIVRGAGTLVGLAELARPSTLRVLRRSAPSPWTLPMQPSRQPRSLA